MDKENIRVVVIEDDPMVQEINRQFIERVPAFQVVGVAVITAAKDKPTIQAMLRNGAMDYIAGRLGGKDRCPRMKWTSCFSASRLNR